MRTTIFIGLTAAALGACQAPPPFKAYSYPAWGFSASFRAAPKETDYPPTARGHRTMLVESLLAGRDNLVYVVDGTGSTKPDEDVLNDAPKTLATSVGGTVGPMTYAATGKVVGEEFTLTRPDKPAARVRIFVANKHLYEVISGSTLGPDDPEVTEFLDSFRLL